MHHLRFSHHKYAILAAETIREFPPWCFHDAATEGFFRRNADSKKPLIFLEISGLMVVAGARNHRELRLPPIAV
ncbi:hypothetical protein CRT60_03100 [Azospirillum palustre]|uniref:Uncharacterized protein n=1 Tax=Azospirillum palustre TaxID=2044885 RepID=A0A2B8BM15_9PROT|nr:hypothetical protein CRT60_03100 [Azospirillum palustre]